MILPASAARLLRFVSVGLGASRPAVLLPPGVTEAEARVIVDALRADPAFVTLARVSGDIPADTDLVVIVGASQLDTPPLRALLLAERAESFSGAAVRLASLPLSAASNGPTWTIALAGVGPDDTVLEEIAAVESADQRLAPCEPMPSASGRVLHVIAAARRPRRALEIGAGEGASTLWLGTAAAPTGSLVSVERDSARFASVRKRIRRAGLEGAVKVHLGEAERIVPRLGGTFDLVLLDGDPSERSDHFMLVARYAAPGTLVVSRGSVSSAPSLARYQALVRTHPTVRAEIALAVGDGLSLAVLG